MSANDSQETSVESTVRKDGEKETDQNMKIPVSAQRAATLRSNITQIHQRINAVKSTNNISKPVRLVAVSKLKPASDILALCSHDDGTQHDTGTNTKEWQQQVHFGENYVQELMEKSRLLADQSIHWHFIGGLQSNKCTQLAREVTGLWAVESVDSAKKAKALDKGRGEMQHDQTKKEPLRIYVQINTSGEESKSGVEPKSQDLVELCKLIHGDECVNLKLQGLMTIGAIARSKATTAETENEDFVVLRDNRDWVAGELGLQTEDLELSMGMSEDFEGAIVQGSDEVRVGSTIFGERPPKKEAKVLEDVEQGGK